MTDPIADAAQSIQQHEGKPQGIAGEIIGAMHALEEKVEHFLHPDAQQAQGAAGEPQASSTGTSNPALAIQPTPTPQTSNASSAQGDAPNAAGGVSSAEQSTAGSAAGVTEGGAGESGNAGAAESGSASEATTKDGERQNAASDAADQSASSTSSSAAPASSPAGTPAASDSAAKQPHPAVYKLRRFLWTFDAAAVKDLHGALDELEKLV